jgi:flagellar biosynthesis regulator FlaF
MTPEELIQEAQQRILAGDTMMIGAERLEGASALLMAVQRHWTAPDREARLAIALEASREVWCDIQAALAEGAASLPLEVRQNLLILSVYAEGKINECEACASSDAVGALVALTRSLAGSLRDWKVAA